MHMPIPKPPLQQQRSVSDSGKMGLPLPLIVFPPPDW
jgi:hypothetical protein